MLTATEAHLLHRVVTALLQHGESTLAAEVNTCLTANAAARAEMAKQAASRKGKPRGGAPTKAYAVELEPGWRMVVHGVKAAAQAVADALEEVGSKRIPPRVASLGVQLSRAGAWHTLVETDNGTVSLSVTRLDSGTEDAS